MLEHNLPGKSGAEFENRIEELRAQLRLLKIGFLERTDRPDQSDITLKLAIRLGKAETDVAWIGALRIAGFDPAIISSLWNIKDEITRNMNINSDIP